MMGYIGFLPTICCPVFVHIAMCHQYSPTVELRDLQNFLFPNWLFLCDVIDLNAIYLRRHRSEGKSASYWPTRLYARASPLGCQLPQPLVASVRVVTLVRADVFGVMYTTEYCE